MIRTHADRDKLDESNDTAHQCEACGNWTLDARWIRSGDEQFAFCPKCACVSHTKPPLVCADCGEEMERRIGLQGRQAARCGPCKLTHWREYHKLYKRRMRAAAKAARSAPEPAPEDCQGCGAPINNGGKLERCPECSANS